MPDNFCEVAFQLPINEVSEPFRTHFGWHLCVVKEKFRRLERGGCTPGDHREGFRGGVGAKTDRITQLARIELIGK